MKATTNILVHRAAIALAIALLPNAVVAAEELKEPTGKPVISRFEPRSIERGAETLLHIQGEQLIGLSGLKFSHEKIKGEILESKSRESLLKVTAAADLAPGSYEFSFSNSKGESPKAKLFVDDLPQSWESHTNSHAASFSVKVPVSFWGALDPAGDSDILEFAAETGQSLVFDVAAKSIGSKAGILITLFDAKGNLLAQNNGFGGGDPLLHYVIPASGHYRLHISDQTLAGSAEHFYRVSIGEFPVVTGSFPMTIKAGTTAEMELAGFNLGQHRSFPVFADKAGELKVRIDRDKLRMRKPVQVMVTEQNEYIEKEPNDSPARAMRIAAPAVVNGRIWNGYASGKITSQAGDEDLFQFEAAKGDVWVIETEAERRGSPLDTKIEILHADGKPVERLLLQAVRDSQINFRPIDSVTGDVRVENWEEMELNQFMYLGGEVCKIFRMPEGPDSGFQFYRNGGKRRSYFDTSPTAHALDDPCYIVEPHPPGTQLVPNGLPVFPVYFANDDDGERKIGADSRVHFTAPQSGTFLIRVQDTRDQSDERFAYRLIVRRAEPDFSVRLGNPNPTVSPGSGTEFSLTVDREDGFDENVRVDITGVPEGFYMSSPIVIQAGHLQANGALFASPDAKEPAAEATSKIKITATATIAGKTVTKDVNKFGKIKLAEKPKLMVAIEPYNESNPHFTPRNVTDEPLSVTIAPGQILPVWLKVKRDGHDDIVTFSVDNLPHGVIVDNIGLNGVLIPKDEDHRQIFLKAAKWVPETDRLAYCQARQAGNPTSFPVMIRVRKDANSVVASQ